MARINFAPACFASETSDALSVNEAEELLEHWFGRPVVLTSSGRAALLLCLRELGLARYASRVAMPAQTAQCVFDAVVRTAFPVDPSTDTGTHDATLLIHQYGHVAKDRPLGPVIEDICHAFFASPLTGDRNWAGEMAIFSLPKFFGIRGMCGGIVAMDDVLADRLRLRRDASPMLDPATLKADQSAWRVLEPSSLEEIYLRALIHPACDPSSMVGLPSSINGLREAGRQRAQATHLLLNALPSTALDDDWRTMCYNNLPFALPVFVPPDAAAELSKAIAKIGIESGLYNINFSRVMTAPEMRPSLLVPCHGNMTSEEISKVCQILETL